MPRITITVPEKTPQPYRFQMDREVVTIGRGSENDMIVDSGSVSVLHAEMHRVRAGYELRDLGSTNGITLDGVRQEMIRLRTGAVVKMGDVTFDFVLTPDEEAVLAGEDPVLMAVPVFETLPVGLPVALPVALPPLPSPEPAPGSDRAPAPAPEPAPVTSPLEIRHRSGGGTGGFLFLLVFVVLAFFGGLAARYHKETGRSFIDAMTSRFSPVRPASSTPVP